jgi:hypothetical protein
MAILMDACEKLLQYWDDCDEQKILDGHDEKEEEGGMELKGRRQQWQLELNAMANDVHTLIGVEAHMSAIKNQSDNDRLQAFEPNVKTKQRGSGQLSAERRQASGGGSGRQSPQRGASPPKDREEDSPKRKRSSKENKVAMAFRSVFTTASSSSNTATTTNQQQSLQRRPSRKDSQELLESSASTSSSATATRNPSPRSHDYRHHQTGNTDDTSNGAMPPSPSSPNRSTEGMKRSVSFKQIISSTLSTKSRLNEKDSQNQ